MAPPLPRDPRETGGGPIRTHLVSTCASYPGNEYHPRDANTARINKPMLPELEKILRYLSTCEPFLPASIQSKPERRAK